MKLFKIKQYIFRKLHHYEERDGKVYLRFNRALEWRFKSIPERLSFVNDVEPKVTLRQWTWSNRKRLTYNIEFFGKWIIQVLKYTAPRELGQGELFDCQGVSLHPDNNLFLSQYIDPYSYLEFSPRDKKELSLHEVEIAYWFRDFSSENS